MYLVNYLSLQTAQQLFIAVGRYRTEATLVGPRDGVNYTFQTPSGEKFTHNLPFLTIQVYYNGVRQKLLDDYIVQESGGSGSGFDTIIFAFAPRADDNIVVDYVIA